MICDRSDLRTDNGIGLQLTLLLRLLRGQASTNRVVPTQGCTFGAISTQTTTNTAQEETGKKLGEFFSTTAAPPKTVQRIPKVLKEIEGQESSIQNWGIVGFCWGGKIVNLSSQSGTPFKAAAACHPAMVDPSDAPGVTIPYAMLPSKDEDKDAVSKWQQGVKTPNVVEWFDTQVHGFMAAR